MANILIIDDDKGIRKTLMELLRKEGYNTDDAVDGAEGLKKFSTKNFDVVLCDVKMPKTDGIVFLEKAQSINADIPIIMISSNSTVSTAIKAVRAGAFDYINKPPDLNRLLITIKNALNKKELIWETKQLKRKISRVQQIIGESAAMEKIKHTIDKVAPTDAKVLITGENGVGKELVARWIHEKSNRRNAPFVELNCSAVSEELIESELFGHEKDSFTAATKQHIGKFEQAKGGTLFLDEIGDMSLSAQAKVLQALEQGKINRVGGEKDLAVDIRIIAATNKDLAKEVEKKRFRLDLYHRLSVIIIYVPSLNQRKEDIPSLVQYFIKWVATEYNQPLKQIDKEAEKALQEYPWKGNIRELRNAVERLMIFAGSVITKDDVENYVFPSPL
ncbi:MAG: sigma-54-dependent Fis family transcriptional regulator [Ferruginibacter sp.]|nr:sigma-54-dependent Fis family transcriptional regulator [Ferruginibacter sp.]